MANRKTTAKRKATKILTPARPPVLGAVVIDETNSADLPVFPDVSDIDRLFDRGTPARRPLGGDHRVGAYGHPDGRGFTDGWDSWKPSGFKFTLATSATSPIQVNWYEGLPEGWGKLGGTFCPGKKDGVKWDRDLDADLAVLRAEGVNVLVSMPEQWELDQRKVGHLVEAALSYGITTIRFPTKDHNPPGSIDATRAIVSVILDLLKGGVNVVIHCVGGRGRTGTLVGCTLVGAGMGSEQALKVARTRPGAAENFVQERFVHAFGLLFGGINWAQRL